MPSGKDFLTLYQAVAGRLMHENRSQPEEPTTENSGIDAGTGKGSR
jgi:hypothetical protein